MSSTELTQKVEKVNVSFYFTQHLETDMNFIFRQSTRRSRTVVNLQMFPLALPLTSANSIGSGETARMRRLA